MYVFVVEGHFIFYILYSILLIILLPCLEIGLSEKGKWNTSITYREALEV